MSSYIILGLMILLVLFPLIIPVFVTLVDAVGKWRERLSQPSPRQPTAQVHDVGLRRYRPPSTAVDQP